MGCALVIGIRVQRRLGSGFCARYLLLLLLSGMVFPLAELPGPLRAVARALPSGALAEVFHGALGAGGVPGRAWVVLGVWAVVAPLAAARWFRWE